MVKSVRNLSLSVVKLCLMVTISATVWWAKSLVFAWGSLTLASIPPAVSTVWVANTLLSSKSVLIFERMSANVVSGSALTALKTVTIWLTRFASSLTLSIISFCLFQCLSRTRSRGTPLLDGLASVILSDS